MMEKRRNSETEGEVIWTLLAGTYPIASPTIVPRFEDQSYRKIITVTLHLKGPVGPCQDIQPYDEHEHQESFHRVSELLSFSRPYAHRPPSNFHQPPQTANTRTPPTMDFASLMATEISKSTSTKPSTPPTPTPSEPTKKYLKRAELEAQRQQAYLDSQAALRRERESKLLQKRKLDEEDAVRTAERDEKRRRLAEESRIRREEEEAKKERARRKRLGLPALPDKTVADGPPTPESEADIPSAELVPKLRALSEPAFLFGETHPQRLRRYHKHVANTAPSQPTMTAGPIPTTLSLLPETEMKVSPRMPKDGEGRGFLFRQLASYFTMVLTEWSRALSARAVGVKESHQGKQAYNAYVQSRTNMTPLFRKFECGQLEEGILTPMVEIVVAAQEKRYVDANDGYLRLSIGKAAWPIGVTMVGIHERSAREKLHESDNAAHIMSDEVTRKFLQSIKRCLSFAQTRWPPEDLMQLMG